MTSNSLPDENKKQQHRPLNIPFIFFFPRRGNSLRSVSRGKFHFMIVNGSSLHNEKSNKWTRNYFLCWVPEFLVSGEHIGCHSINIIAAGVMFGWNRKCHWSGRPTRKTTRGRLVILPAIRPDHGDAHSLSALSLFRWVTNEEESVSWLIYDLHHQFGAGCFNRVAVP